MSSVAKDIMTAFGVKIEAIATGFKKSPYNYSPDKNNTKTNSKNYRIFPEDGNFSSGGLQKTVIKEQRFTVFLSTSYSEGNDNDKNLQDAVELLNASHELIQTEGMRNRFGIPGIQVVSGFSFSAPEIDSENKTVSLSTTYTISYRVG